MAQVQPSGSTVDDAGLSARPGVFVSYAREDAAFVQGLSLALAERGKSVWVDVEDIPPTAEWRAEVEAGIESTDAFVAVISPDSLRSEVCASELAHAVEHNKRIIPLLHREAGDVPVPSELESRNWVFIRDTDNFDAGIEKLLSALETNLDWVRAHTRLGMRATEWRVHREDGSFLLSGSDLREAEGWLVGHDGVEEPRPTSLQKQYVLASRRATTRRQRLLLTAVLVVLAVTATLALFAWVQRGMAIERANVARSQALAASAVAQLPADPEVSVLLADEAAKIAPTTEAEAALRLALPQSLIETTQDAHDGEVHTVEFSPDGRYVLSAGEDGVAKVWDWRAGRQARSLRVQPPPSGEFGPPTAEERLNARFSPDGSLILAAAPGRAVLWRWQGGEREPLGEGLDYQLARFGSADILLIAVSSENRVIVRGLADGSERSVQLSQLDMSDLRYVVFNAQRQLLLLGDLSGAAAIWDVARWEQVARFDGLGRAGPHVIAYGMALSGDGRYLAVGGSDGTTRVWDARAQRQVVELQGHSSSVSAVAFDATGDLLLTASWDGTARIWDWQQRQAIATVRGHRGWVTTAAFSRDARRVVTGGADGTVRVWNVVRQRSLASVRAGEDTVWSVDTSPDGPWIVTASVLYGANSAVRTVRVWDGALRQRLAELRWPAVGLGDYAPQIDAAFGPAGKIVAIDGQEGSLWVWDWRRNRPRRTGASPPSTEPRRAATLVGKVKSWATGAAFSPDGSFVASSASDSFARVWNWREQKLVAELATEGANKDEMLGPDRWLETVAFSPDGDYVLGVGNRGRIWIWEWRRAKLTAELQPGVGTSTAAFSPDGRLLAAASSSGTVAVYDWRRGRAMAELRHGERVQDVQFSADGKLILTAALDGVARVWDWEAERVVLELVDHGSWVSSATFAQGGKKILTGDDQGVARLFSCSICGTLEDLQKLVPEYVTRRLSKEERLRYRLP